MKSSLNLTCRFVRPAICGVCLSGALMFPLDSSAQETLPAPPVQIPVENIAPLVEAVQGTLDVEILIVDELVPRRVPFTAFRVLPLLETEKPREIRTGEDGKFSLELPPGKYRFETPAPLKFKGKTYEWMREFEIKAGQKTELRLTGEDAISRDDMPQTARVVADEAKIYRALRDGVATIESESGSGTGFLVDGRGVLLTNHHVVEGSRELVVRFRSGLRAGATILAMDPQNDVAVIRVNPEISAKLPVVPLSRPKPQREGETAPSIAVEGEKIMAIGSPLGEEKILTTGLISRVKDGLLISDVNINPGNSGGPLLNMAGEAIGLTTFGESAGSGPGLSGIVSLERAFPTLDKALAILDKAQKDGKEKMGLPSARLLPDFSPVSVPAASLEAASQTEIKIPFFKAPGSFETRFLTPFNLTSVRFQEERELAKKQAKRRGKQGKNGAGEVATETRTRFYNAEKAAIYISVVPKLMESKGSKKRGLFGAILGGMTGTFVPTKRSLEFRHDFYNMELLRNGIKVEPLERKRVPLSIYYQNVYVNLEAKDTTMVGIYAFDPTAFAPGSPLILQVWREYNTQKPELFKISDSLRASLYEQFAAHRGAVQSAATQTTTQTLSLSPAVSVNPNQ